MPDPSTPPDLETLITYAVQLPKYQRLELIASLQAYNQAEAEQKVKQPKAPLNRRGIRGGRGSFEDKYINGYGPYRYLRYWYGKTHKSIYLGKVKLDLPD
jgi:hypothetical protein